MQVPESTGRGCSLVNQRCLCRKPFSTFSVERVSHIPAAAAVDGEAIAMFPSNRNRSSPPAFSLWEHPRFGAHQLLPALELLRYINFSLMCFIFTSALNNRPPVFPNTRWEEANNIHNIPPCRCCHSNVWKAGSIVAHPSVGYRT